MNLDIDTWLTFAQDNWIVIVVAIAAILIVMKVVKTVLKWVLVAAIVIGIVTYGGLTIDDIKEVGTKVSEEAKDQAIKAMAGEASDATYTMNADGSYTITTKNLELNGVPNSGEVSVKLKGISLGTWKMEGEVRDFVSKARAAAK
ncbi:hypothetical protein [Cohnella terricola]|uniref:Uncharacterized protein n=1 Tax=Cohnella terricola TaxID=1289167 RepID=A0A559JFT7_9BACL|nr:hypothetical protein [Cohnella terricola]TVX98730.1 hypothetical protein FPZ45_15645 [Cohnella terricola]